MNIFRVHRLQMSCYPVSFGVRIYQLWQTLAIRAHIVFKFMFFLNCVFSFSSKHQNLTAVFYSFSLLSSSSVGGSGWSIRRSSFITSGYRSWSYPLSTIGSSLFWGRNVEYGVWKLKVLYPSMRIFQMQPLCPCSVRTCFTTIALSYLPVWLTLDYLSDLMYIFDMIITVRTGEHIPFFLP